MSIKIHMEDGPSVFSEDITIGLIKCGRERCLSDKRAETGDRLYNSLHYVYQGEGYLLDHDEIIRVHKGSVFLIHAHDKIQYYPDSNDPWSFIWADFIGDNLDVLFRNCGLPENKHWITPKTTRKLGEIVLFAILALFGICMLYPFLWMFFTSFKPLNEVYTTGLLNHTWSFSNFWDVWGKVNILSGLKASLVFSVSLTFTQILTACMAGYAFAKIEFPLKNLCFMLILFSMTIPYVTIMIPQFMMLEQFGIVSNGPWGYIIPRLAGGASTIFFVRQYCYSIPGALIESAQIDGAGQGRIFFKIILPSLVPVVAVQGLFIFIFIWNDYLGPSIFLIDENWWTIQMFVSRFSSGQIGSAGAANVPMQMCVAVIITIPLLILFFFTQKHIVNSLIQSGIKE